jgi:hypothetical protein
MEALSSGLGQFALRTNDAANTKLGPTVSGAKGLNQLAVHETDTQFAYEGDADAGDQLNVKNSYWFTFSGSTFSQIDNVLDFQDITDRFDPSGYDIAYSPFETGAPDAVASACEGSSARRLVQVDVFDANATDDPNQEKVPTKLTLGVIRPNPTRGALSILLAVPKDNVGRYTLEVVDVTGKRVHRAESTMSQPGRYLLNWNGSDGDGASLASGIYFLRLEGPNGVLETRKVTLVR